MRPGLPAGKHHSGRGLTHGSQHRPSPPTPRSRGNGGGQNGAAAVYGRCHRLRASVGRIARIARVHQFGLKDRAVRGAPDVRYHQREVLGFTRPELGRIHERLLAHLTI
ncbi:hypothetical protein EKA85_21625 [Pseudomonas veronii]|nr:hypothetical protein EKA85_21625 [Pseudomonas veronii]